MTPAHRRRWAGGQALANAPPRADGCRRVGHDAGQTAGGRELGERLFGPVDPAAHQLGLIDPHLVIAVVVVAAHLPGVARDLRGRDEVCRLHAGKYGATAPPGNLDVAAGGYVVARRSRWA